MKNNLFQWATSELSQDAFICWLMSYAMEGAKQDASLKACAQAFVRKFLQLKDENAAIVVNNIERQVSVKDKEQKKRNIDVLLTVNGKYKIIVEDKTYTSEHDDQLQVYKDAITDLYPKHTVVGVYYKTGFQSDYEIVDKAGYCQIGLAEIVKLLGEYKDKTTNVIFNDYCEYLTDLHTKAEQFKSLPIQNWDWQQIYGFYNYLIKEKFLSKYGFNKTNFDYVANPAGGFDGFWTSKEEHYVYTSDQGSLKYEIYLLLQFSNGKKDKENLQASNLKMCLKVNVTDIQGITLSDFTNKLIYDEKWQYRLEKYNYGKPDRLRAGKNMTLGFYNRKNKTDKKYEKYDQVIDALKSAMQGFDEMTKAICIGEKYGER